MFWLVVVICLFFILLGLWAIHYRQNLKWKREYEAYQNSGFLPNPQQDDGDDDVTPESLYLNSDLSDESPISHEDSVSHIKNNHDFQSQIENHEISHANSNNIISLKEATRHLSRNFTERSQQEVVPVHPRETITFDDPSVKRVRTRNLAEVEDLNRFSGSLRHESQDVVRRVAENEHLETIDLNDIRAGLLRQRQARRNQNLQTHSASQHTPDVIARDEVLANLARAGAAQDRLNSPRLKRKSVHSITTPYSARSPVSNNPKPLHTQTAKPTANDNAISLPEPVNIAPAEIAEPEIIESPAVFNQTMPFTLAAEKTVESTWEGLREHSKPNNSWQLPENDDLMFTLNDDNQNDADNANQDENQANGDLLWLPEKTQFDDEKENKFPLPNLNLLLPAQHNPAAVQSEEAMIENSAIIESKLAEFKVKVNVVDAYAGPVITRYEIEPDVGVRGSAVLNLGKDLARSLGLESLRVVETIPGKTCMGLELPNPKRQMIRLSEIFTSNAFQQSESKLTLALGQDITGKPIVTDLAKAPHLLVAGTTGSGKSVGVNAMILSMLFKCSPEEVRLIMIDPKMLELSIYEGIPHLLAPVVTDMRLSANALNWCVEEMEKRYRLMSHVRVRNIAGYNQKIEEAKLKGQKIGNPFSLTPEDPEPLQKLPYIVVVVDEFADLMMTAGKKIEELIARITQKARAAGIHLILATQRPSVDVVTGLIKANIPTRIAFQVSSKIDSRTILDQMGAENLLGQGDMLFLPPGTSYPQRVHGAFVADSEVQAVVDYLKQFGAPEYIEDILTSGSEEEHEAENIEGNNTDPFDEAVAIVLRTQKTSISFLQRKMRIGYNRAADLIEQMEAEGILSEPDASGKRTILARSAYHNE